jgi:hypothetical protein
MPNRNTVRALRIVEESGSPLASYVMILTKEKVRLRKSSQDGKGPRKTLS